MIICAGDNENFSFAKQVGIGLVEVAMNLTELILEKKPKNLLFIGSAGSYGKAKIFDKICTNRATNIEIGFFEKLSYTPKSDYFKGINSNVSHETLSDFVVNSSSYITTNETQSNLFLKNNLYIENMEFFSILLVAQRFNIPAIGLFCVTNFCFKNAHEEFLKNHEKAKEILEIEAVKNFKEYF